MAASNFHVPTIIANNVHVRYTANTNDPSQRSKGLRRIGNAVTGRNGQTTVRALRGVNFVAQEGEMVGIVGSNGSGKSTFLRNVAGVEQPDRGRILVRYQPLLLGVSAALQPALSGSENVRLGCLAMGLSPEEASEAFEYVVELSALGAAIHRPMGTYSSGMGARLRFAIALAAQPKILLIDEALSTGDATFGERSERAMDELLAEAGTVLLVNHAAKVIQELCTRAVWMHKGEILMNGPAAAVAEKYRWWAWNVAKGKEDTAGKLLQDVVKNAVKDEINILEPELVRDAIPRHAARPMKKTKSKAARHVKTTNSCRNFDETSAARSFSSRPHTWSPDSENSPVKAKFPEPTQPQSTQAWHNEAPPIRLRSGDRQVILRAEHPQDRASAVGSMSDLTGRRLESRAQRVANERYDERQRLRQTTASPPRDEPQ